MTNLEAAKIVAILMAVFPHSDSTLATSAVYETELRDLDYATADRAVRRLIATAKFRPTISEIREAAVEVAHGIKRTGADGWGDVLKAVSKFGAYRKPVFADPLVARAVDALTWSAICLSENQVADRARFIAAYESYTDADRRELQIPAPLRMALGGEVWTTGPRTLAEILKALPEPDDEGES